jgi:hypothetical protein
VSTQLKERRVTKPANGWRNIYWLEREINIGGEPRGPGRTPSKFVWPSKDLAETMAEKNKEKWAELGVMYLGAEEEK